MLGQVLNLHDEGAFSNGLKEVACGSLGDHLPERAGLPEVVEGWDNDGTAMADIAQYVHQVVVNDLWDVVVTGTVEYYTILAVTKALDQEAVAGTHASSWIRGYVRCEHRMT